jgi:predicted nucleic acid-binding protein
MKAVFDTNVLIDYLNGVADAERELSLYDQRLISTITYIEVMVGARNSDEEEIIKGFLSSFEIKELTAPIADAAILLRQTQKLKIPDAIVYATAKVEGTILVTRDSKDLRDDWPDIRVPYKLTG